MTYRNGLIDGWRGISVVLVIVGHLASYRFHLPDYSISLQSLGLSPQLANQILLRVVASAGLQGVSIFFVISGYLITTLLIHEHKHRSLLC